MPGAGNEDKVHMSPYAAASAHPWGPFLSLPPSVMLLLICCESCFSFPGSRDFIFLIAIFLTLRTVPGPFKTKLNKYLLKE